VTLVVPDRVVAERFTMRDCVRAVEDGYRAAGEAEVLSSLRAILAPEGRAALLTYSASAPALGLAMSWAYSGSPEGADRSGSTVTRRQKVVSLFDLATGACVAVIGGRTLSQLVTGAAGAVAIDHLAKPDARCLALVGAGRQARVALAGAREVRELDDVRVWSRTRARADSFAAAHPGVRAVDGAREAVDGADIVVTCTTSWQPVVRGAWLAPGSHVNAIGAHRRDRRELDGDAVAGALVVADTRQQALDEKGELILAMEEGRFSSDSLVELGTVVAAGRPYPRAPGQRSLFASSGSGIEALAGAAGVYRLLADDPAVTRLELDA
jgi:alanine dehydrogenase